MLINVFQSKKIFLTRPLVNVRYCGQPLRARGFVLGLRPPVFEFRTQCLEESVGRGPPSKHKTFVYHLYNVGTTSKTFGRRCANVIQMFCVCVCWADAVIKADCWESWGLRVRTPLCPSSFKKMSSLLTRGDSILWGASVTER